MNLVAADVSPLILKGMRGAELCILWSTSWAAPCIWDFTPRPFRFPRRPLFLKLRAMFKPADLFDLSQTTHAALFDGCEYAWDGLRKLKEYLKGNLRPALHNKCEGTAWIGERVFVGEGTVVEDGAMIKGPAIIGRNCQIRHNAYVREDAQAARAIIPQDDALDKMNAQVSRQLIDRMARDPEQLRGYINLMFIARHLERVGDHATNIGEDAVYAAAAEDIRHQQVAASPA